MINNVGNCRFYPRGWSQHIQTDPPLQDNTVDRYTANNRKEGALWLPINIHIGKKKKKKNTTKTLIVTILCPGTIFQKSSQKSFFIPQVSDTNI